MHNFKMNINEYLPLRDVVFYTLRQAILKGELEPGERLMEMQLAEQLGVSRTPIREAIRKLELEGLVLMIPRRGAIVAKITEKDLRDVLEVRSSLERLSTELACDRIKDETIQELRQAVEKAHASDVALEALSLCDRTLAYLEGTSPLLFFMIIFPFICVLSGTPSASITATGILII